MFFSIKLQTCIEQQKIAIYSVHTVIIHLEKLFKANNIQNWPVLQSI